MYMIANFDQHLNEILLDLYLNELQLYLLLI